MQAKQRVFFDIIPTNPDQVQQHAYIMVNVTTGIGIDTLTKTIEERIPIVEEEDVLTSKKVVRTSRYACPCCQTILTALVEVNCSGPFSKKWNEVQGLYLIEIMDDFSRPRCEVTVARLATEKMFYEGRCPHLPRENYVAVRPESDQK